MDDLMHYLGGGYVIGVPARDLTMDEWDSLPPEARATAEASGLYQQGGDETAADDDLEAWPDIMEEYE